MERSEFETWLCHRVVFLGETLDSHSAPLHPGISMDTREFSGKPDVILGGNLRMNWRPIQGGGGSNIPRHLCYGNRDKLRLDWPLASTTKLSLIVRRRVLLHLIRVCLAVNWCVFVLLVREKHRVSKVSRSRG